MNNDFQDLLFRVSVSGMFLLVVFMVALLVCSHFHIGGL